MSNKTKSKVFSLERLYKFCVKKNFNKNFGFEKNFGSEKNFQKNFRSKKKFGVKKILSLKKCWLQKNFDSKFFLEPINFLV